MYSWLMFFCLVGVTSLSCTKDTMSKSTYISYSVNGASCNGPFLIEDTGDPTMVRVTAAIVAASGDRPETVVITYIDYTQNRIVYCYLPAARTGPVLMTDSSPFSLGISDNAHHCSLTSGVENTAHGVSTDVTRFERGSITIGHGSVREIQANFEGIMTFWNHMDEIEMHTIKGDLYYSGF
jgi:hypothetical protein